MLKLTNRAAVTAALTDQTLDPELRALIGLRAWQLDDVRRQPLGETVQFFVVQPRDTPTEIHNAVGFPITWEQADQPGFEWMEDHGSWFELAYALTDDFTHLRDADRRACDHPGVSDGVRDRATPHPALRRSHSAPRNAYLLGRSSDAGIGKRTARHLYHHRGCRRPRSGDGPGQA